MPLKRRPDFYASRFTLDWHYHPAWQSHRLRRPTHYSDTALADVSAALYTEVNLIIAGWLTVLKCVQLFQCSTQSVTRKLFSHWTCSEEIKCHPNLCNERHQSSPDNLLHPTGDCSQLFFSHKSHTARAMNRWTPTTLLFPRMPIVKSKSKWHYDWQAVSQSVSLVVQLSLRFMARNFVYSYCLGHVRRTLWREVWVVSCQSLLAVLSPLSKFHCIYVLHITHVWCIQYMQGLCQSTLSTADHSPSFVAYAYLNGHTLDRRQV
jgi:hypothetical protein